MGTHKQALLEKAKATVKKNGSSKGEKLREKSDALHSALSHSCSDLLDLLEEDGIDMLDIRVYRKKDYTHLGIAKFEIGEDNYVAFATGEDYWEILVNLSQRIGERGLSKEKPWEGRK